MSNDGIRLPSDSTVASQKVHRGSTLPDTQITTNTPKEVPPGKPLLTVVLQAKPILEGKKGALFDLILQNDPKSAPPIRMQSDTRIAPGTSLILEASDDNQFQPVKNPTQAQLSKLIQLELEFWRAHLLPKAGRRVFPTLPASEQLSALVAQQPTLKPLVQWITQQPQALTSNTVQSWIRELAPLSVLRSWNAPNSNLTIPVNQSTQGVQSSVSPQPNNANTALNSAVSVNSGQTQTNQQPLKLAVPDLRLNQPIGLLLQKITIPPSKSIDPNIQRNDVTAQSRPLLQTTTLQRAEFIQANTPLKFAGQIFKSASSVLSIGALRDSVIFVRPNATVTQSSQQIANNAQGNVTVTPNLSSGMSSNTNASTSISVSPSNPGQPSPLPPTTPINLPPTSPGSQTQSKTAAPLTPQTVSLNNQPVLQQAAASITHNELIPPTPVRTETLGRIPLEVILTQWQTHIDSAIQQSPAAMQAKIRTQAADALQQLSQQAKVSSGFPTAEVGAKPDAANDEQPIVQLRNWLDATVARLQNNAIQIAAAQWATPETPVQQMQLPLIWLGLTSWADIEWWQEKPAQKKDAKKKQEEERRRWRMKVYLTLSPLAPVCADIDWSTDSTNVTFWSEDASTLHHLNSLLPKLHEWTDGLGEKQLSTKHGMPKRADQKQPAQTQQHLVDIRT